MKSVFVATMYKFGNREKHSYVLGVYADGQIAKYFAEEEFQERGGKYNYEILEIYLNKEYPDGGWKNIFKLEQIIY